MSDTAKSINYIQTELIPGMVERQQLTIDGIGAEDTVRLDCVEAKPLQADGTFMLTVLYKVKVELSSAKDGTIKQERRLVVKVCKNKFNMASKNKLIPQLLADVVPEQVAASIERCLLTVTKDPVQRVFLNWTTKILYQDFFTTSVLEICTCLGLKIVIMIHQYVCDTITPQCTEEMYTGCQFDTLFENEMTAYTEIIPALGKAERYPKYFYSHRKPFEAVMVLSDYSTEGWRMAPMVVNLPLDYCLLAARELGRFHGECYALKEQQRDSFESMISKFKEARYGNDLGDMKWLAVMKTGPVRALKATRESIFSESIPEEFLQKLGDLAADPWEYSKKCVKPVEPLAVICHGDYLRNNIAFQFADEQAPGKPTQAMMFDFQTLRYASPMIDFATFIANSTGYDVRQKHFETIFKAYHDELVQTLCSIIKTNPDDLPQHYSYESFLREFTRYYIYGFLIATSFLMILHEPTENVFEMEQWSLEEIVQDTMKRGGAKLDREFAAMVYEIYKLHQRFGMDPM